jgi:LDH2 family malate/lactate/ureidoglycolate dehydrogenase
MVGTNPVGIAVPTLGSPLIVDMSTAEVSAGKILDHAARGEAIPLGWAVDEAGVPTTDALAAARGSLSPFGGAKGYALGLGLEALVGLLAGSAFGQDVHGTLDTDHPPTKGDLMMVFSIDALGSSGGLHPLSGFLEDVRATGVEAPALIPGDRARRELARREADGIPLDARVWADAVALSEGAVA